MTGREIGREVFWNEGEHFGKELDKDRGQGTGSGSREQGTGVREQGNREQVV
jgi:hypothetical protein